MKCIKIDDIDLNVEDENEEKKKSEMVIQ